MQKQSPNIFVVDDDLMFHHLVGVTIGSDHTGLQYFSSGESAIERIREGEVPDLMILDFNLGSMTGLEVLKTIRKKLPNLKVVMLSAQEDVEVTLSVIKAGAFDYIVKNSQAMDNLRQTISVFRDIESGFLTWN